MVNPLLDDRIREQLGFDLESELVKEQGFGLPQGYDKRIIPYRLPQIRDNELAAFFRRQGFGLDIERYPAFAQALIFEYFLIEQERLTGFWHSCIEGDRDPARNGLIYQFDGRTISRLEEATGSEYNLSRLALLTNGHERYYLACKVFTKTSPGIFKSFEIAPFLLQSRSQVSNVLIITKDQFIKYMDPHMPQHKGKSSTYVEHFLKAGNSNYIFVISATKAELQNRTKSAERMICSFETVR